MFCVVDKPYSYTASEFFKWPLDNTVHKTVVLF